MLLREIDLVLGLQPAYLCKLVLCGPSFRASPGNLMCYCAEFKLIESISLLLPGGRREIVIECRVYLLMCCDRGLCVVSVRWKC